MGWPRVRRRRRAGGGVVGGVRGQRQRVNIMHGVCLEAWSTAYFFAPWPSVLDGRDGVVWVPLWLPGGVYIVLRAARCRRCASTESLSWCAQGCIFHTPDRCCTWTVRYVHHWLAGLSYARAGVQPLPTTHWARCNQDCRASSPVKVSVQALSVDFRQVAPCRPRQHGKKTTEVHAHKKGDTIAHTKHTIKKEQRQ